MEVDSRPVGYAALPPSEQPSPTCEPSDPRANDPSVRFIRSDQYLEETTISGIPQPPVTKDAYSFIDFTLAFLALSLCMAGLYYNNGVYGTIPFSEGLDRITVDVTGCDVMFRATLPGEEPGLHYRTWGFMGSAVAEVEPGSLALTLKNSRRLPLFHCNAVFRVEPGTEIANELLVRQHGGFAAVVTEGIGASDGGSVEPLVSLGKSLRLELNHAQCQLAGMDAPKAEVLIAHGLLELDDPRVADLTVSSASAPVALRSSQRPLELSMSQASAERAALYAGALQVQKSSDKLEASLAPAKADAAAALDPVTADVSAESAPIMVLCGSRETEEGLQSHYGSEQRTPQFVGSGEIFRSVEAFVKDSRSLPFVVNVRVVGHGVPHGVWQVMSTNAYLALSVDWLVLFSAGALKPRVFHAEVHALGLGLRAEPSDIFELLHAELPEIIETFTVAWAPSEKGEPLLVFEQSGHKFHPRRVTPADIAGFVFSLALNLTGALAITAYLGYFMVKILYPYLLARQCEATVAKCASHRLCFVNSLGAWQISACSVGYDPCHGLRQAGVLLRWKMRSNYSTFKRYHVRCHSATHRFNIVVSKQEVMPSANNPSQLELFIPLYRTGGANERVESLKVGHDYKFQVVGVGFQGHDVQTSSWSSLVRVGPPVSFTDLPLMLLKVFAGRRDEGLSSLDIFCKSCVSNKNTCTKIMLHDMRLDLHHSVYESILEMVEDGLDLYLTAEWDGGREEDCKFIDFGNRSQPPFRPGKSEQFYTNVAPLDLTVTRSSEEQEVLIVRLGTRQGDVAFQLSAKFQELHSQWEKQYDYYGDEAPQEVTIFNMPECCGPKDVQGLGPGLPWWREVPEEHRRSCLTKTPAGCKMRCWVAFGHDDPYEPDSASVRWLQYPQTPYARPNEVSAGKPAPISMPWPRATIRGIFPNEVVLQGTRKVLYFSEELEIDGNPVEQISLELRPAFRSEVERFQRRVSQEAVPVSQGSFIWDVKFVDNGEQDMNDRFVLVAHVDGQEFLAASVEFLIVRPVLLSEFEMGYAAFCRAYELPMESLEDVKLDEVGIRVSTIPLSICEGLRAVLPQERYCQSRKSLRFCTFEGSMVPSARPIILEREAQIYRCALRMVKVLEGTHWRVMHEALKFDLLLAYNFDHSWDLSRKLRMEKLRPVFKHLLVVLLYFVQILSFLIPPISAFFLLVLHQYLHQQFCPHYYLADPGKMYLTDWLYSPAHLEVIRVQTPAVQAAVAAIMAYSCGVMATLVYMNFFRSRNRKVDSVLNKITSAIIGTVSFVSAAIVCMALLWVCLAAMINPHDVMPYAVMLGSILYTSKRLIASLTKVQQRVMDQVDFMVEKVLTIMVDDYLQGQADVDVSTLKIDQLDPDKAKFVRCLCDLGEEVQVAHRPVVHMDPDSPTSPRSPARTPRAFSHRGSVSGGEIMEAVEDDDDGEDAEDFTDGADAIVQRQVIGGFSPLLRQKLHMCFHFIVAKIPLPPGIQQSLRDPQQLARSCVDRRAAMLQKLVGSDGEGILRDLVERNLDTRLTEALVTVLQKGEESEIDVMDLDSLTREAVLFYDKEFAEQILSMVHCRLDTYLEQLKVRIREAFGSLSPSSEDLVGRRLVERQLAKHMEVFDMLMRKHDFPDELCPHEVDTTGDGVANCKVLPFLQLLGVLPPFHVVEDDPFTRRDSLEKLLLFLTSMAKKVTNGQTVLHKYHISAMVLQMSDNVGDGRVDHMWWDGFLQVCKDIYILKGRDPLDTRAYPVTVQDVAAAWNQEVADTDSPLVTLERIEDVILAKLMTKNGSKKLWLEGLVQLARHVHLWPEVPFDDTVVQVCKGEPFGTCEILNIVSDIIKPESYLHKDLKAIVDDIRQDPPNPPVVGHTPVYKDEPDLVFADMCDFSPENGFAMLWHKRTDLTKPANKPWVTLSWDSDAVRDGSEPPFPGPLLVYLVFTNLHPEQKHAHRPWIKEEGWQHVEGKRPPIVERKSRDPGEEELPWRHSRVSNSHNAFPISTLRRLPGGVKGKTEIFVKRFGENGVDLKARLHGMACNADERDSVSIDPVFVFFQVQRAQMPDAQSFEDAHYAPFCRSKLFKDIWDFYDKAEALRSPEALDEISTHRSSSFVDLAAEDISGKTMHILKKTSATGCIDLTPDAPELLRFIFLRRYALRSPPQPCTKNASLQVIEPEQLRLGLTRADRRTGKRKPFCLQPMQQDFFCEDMSFVELDIAEFKEYQFEARALRGDLPDPEMVNNNTVKQEQSVGGEPARAKDTQRVATKVATLGLVRKGKLIMERAAPPGDGPITISFGQKTVIDQVNFKTLGVDTDPIRWRISGRNSPAEPWKVLFDRETDYPLDPKPELVEVGKRQEGAIWHREGGTWLRLRGLWFDAFHELLGALDLKVDRAAAWSLWRLMLSFKHKPVVPQRYPGFVTIAQAREALSALMAQEAFLSDDLFGWWNVESRLGLQEAFKRKMYAGICSTTPDYHGAANLVRWRDLARILQLRILRSKPYLEKLSAGGRQGGHSRQYIIGSLWFEVLYQIVISSMPERYSRQEVRQHYDAYANPRTGLLALDRTYDVIAKLGRPGLKFSDFSRFVRTLGMQIDRTSLRLAFNRVDIDQSFTLDADDMQSGITLLLRQVLPRQVLQMAGISTEQIVLHVTFWLGVLCVIFFFLILSFLSLLNGRGSVVVSGLQSFVAAVAGLGVSSEGSKEVKQEDIDELVARSMEQTLGSSGRRAAQMGGGGGGGARQ